MEITLGVPSDALDGLDIIMCPPAPKSCPQSPLISARDSLVRTGARQKIHLSRVHDRGRFNETVDKRRQVDPRQIAHWAPIRGETANSVVVRCVPPSQIDVQDGTRKH